VQERRVLKSRVVVTANNTTLAAQRCGVGEAVKGGFDENVNHKSKDEKI